MNVRALSIACALAIVVVAGVWFLTLREPSTTPVPSPEEVASTEPAPPETAPPEASPPAPAPVSPPARPRAAPLPRAEPAPTPPAPEVATLHITADVPGAQVFLDRQFIGTAPVTAENVKPGRRQLNVSAPGFEGIAEAIDVEPGSRDIEVSLRAIRLQAAIPVVHRHRIGSCQGRLVADEQGLRYETTQTNDAFGVGLTELETFEVDYLERNLRVRLRGGRQYNFTEPDGDADRLFVFHRDVERARQQLLDGGGRN
jgi:hypothetical protein